MKVVCYRYAVVADQVAVVVGGCCSEVVVFLEEAADEIGEEVGVEVAEPDEGLLEGGAPIGEEENGDVIFVGGGEI